MDDEQLLRLALVEADAAREQSKKARGRGRGMVKWSDLEREFARHALEELSGEGDRNR